MHHKQTFDLSNQSACEIDVDSESDCMSDRITKCTFFSPTLYLILQYIVQNYDFDDFNLHKMKIVMNFMILNQNSDQQEKIDLKS